MKRVVVTGLGALTPLGNTVAEFAAGLFAGRSGAGPITRFDANHFRTRFACEVKGFDPLNFVEKKDARKMDPFCHYAIAASEECVRDSGLDLEKVNRRRIGVIWGSGNGGMVTFQDEMLGLASTGLVPRLNPFFIPKTIADIVPGMISMRYGFHGPNYLTMSACASSTNAIASAVDTIRLGKAAAILTGGSEAAINMAGIGGFNAMKALSERNDDPQKASRPFDRDRDGFVMGEGGAALMLEDLEHALARGAKIYAEVAGYGMAADAYHLTATHPEGLGATLAMQAALEDAGLLPTDVDYLNVHATSTPLGDDSELKAVAQVFGTQPDHLHISATKSMTGHLLGGAGAIEAIACILAIRDQAIPPTINLDHLDEALPQGFQLTPHQAVKKRVRVAMSNNFGFGGHNAIAVFKAFEG